jgi:hypothetical protein
MAASASSKRGTAADSAALDDGKEGAGQRPPGGDCARSTSSCRPDSVVGREIGFEPTKEGEAAVPHVLLAVVLGEGEGRDGGEQYVTERSRLTNSYVLLSDSAIVLFVTGTIKIGGDNPLHFCEMFQLVAHAPGQYYVHNDVFRLNYGLKK